jgi:hypothetical protein
MTLPASGQLLLSQIQAEFSAPSNTQFSAFVRGGAWVPDTPANAAIATVATSLRFSQFYGASSAPALAVNIANHTIRSESLTEDNEFPPPAIVRSEGRAVYHLKADGTSTGTWYQDAGDGVNTNISTAFTNWLTTGSASAAEVRATVVSGAVSSSDATGVWLNLGTNRSWGANTRVNASGGNSDLCVLTIEIRNATTLVVLDTATVTIADGPVGSAS